MSNATDGELREAIDCGVRQIPDWPHSGVTFRDITPLCGDPQLLGRVNSELVTSARILGHIDAVLGIEARGFIFAPCVAVEINAGFVPVRKKGKLPAKTINASYALEYGTAEIQIHDDALKPGMRVAIVDDVLATGGTMAATAELVNQAGAHVAGFLAIMELAGLQGRTNLVGAPVHVLRTYA